MSDRPNREELLGKYGPSWGLQKPLDENEAAKRRMLETIKRANDLFFRRECEAAGVPADSAVSPSLRKLLGNGVKQNMEEDGNAKVKD